MSKSNKTLYTINEERSYKKALKDNGNYFKDLISLGYGSFIKIHCDNWATIIRIDCCSYEEISIKVNRSILDNDRLDGILYSN